MSKNKASITISEETKVLYLKNIIRYCAYLFIFWGLFRFLSRFPEDIEEFFMKPIIWLIPIYYFVKKEGGNWESVGITTKNLFQSLYLALILGMVFGIEGLLVNYVKYGGFDFGAFIGNQRFEIALVVTLATAISEEIAFRGYVFNRLWVALGSEYKANIITSTIWGLIHLPVVIFWLKLSFPAAVGYLLLTTIFGIGSAFIFARTKNVWSSILLHLLWSWPIILFR